MRQKPLSFTQVRDFQRAVFAGQKQSPRSDLPWRITACVYHTFVSEYMLQQTQASRVGVLFPRFVKRFPSLKKLAAAPVDEVIAAWQGLGYNRRAVFLKTAAQEIVKRHDGVIPDIVELLDALPGLGRATACSIAVFAFNKPVVFIETNIRSVFIHHFFQDKKNVADAQIEALVAQTLYRQDPRRWYEALMDYGVMLKKQTVNPSRRSAHYSRQSAFAGSDRFYRGRIVAMLTEKHTYLFRSLKARFELPTERLQRILAGLVRDGLICMEQGKVSMMRSG